MAIQIILVNHCMFFISLAKKCKLLDVCSHVDLMPKGLIVYECVSLCGGAMMIYCLYVLQSFCFYLEVFTYPIFSSFACYLLGLFYGGYNFR